MLHDRKKTAVGRETRRELLDNLTLDSIAAERAGMSYGKYKAKHPYTYAARDAAGLFDRHKAKGYDLICAHCGGHFIGKTKERKFCCDSCRKAANNAKYRNKQKGKKEAPANEVII